MEEIALKKQVEINELLSKLLEIRNYLDNELLKLSQKEIQDFETFICTDPKWWELENTENHLRSKLGYN